MSLNTVSANGDGSPDVDAKPTLYESAVILVNEDDIKNVRNSVFDLLQQRFSDVVELQRVAPSILATITQRGAEISILIHHCLTWRLEMAENAVILHFSDSDVPNADDPIVISMPIPLHREKVVG